MSEQGIIVILMLHLGSWRWEVQWQSWQRRWRLRWRWQWRWQYKDDDDVNDNFHDMTITMKMTTMTTPVTTGGIICHLKGGALSWWWYYEDDESEKIIDKESPVLPTLHKSTHPKLSTRIHSDKKMSSRSFAAALDDHQDNRNNPHNDVVSDEHLVRVA